MSLDLTSSGGTGKTLAAMVAKGLCTLESLDTPSPGYQLTEKSRTDSRDPLDYTNEKHKVPYYNRDGEASYTYPRPTIEYPAAPQFRNLAREWIEANPKEWQAMLGETGTPERVEVISPRDFSTPLTEPGQELDGVTVYTNQNPLDLNNLPF